MGTETTKSHALRLARGDFDRYLTGNGIDIGAGGDALATPTGTVLAWDLADGDAMLMAGVPDEHFDFVYSSHCLEHLVDIPTALANWVRLLKPGGWLYFAVPDYTLYEHNQWPSRFNPDHKHSFSMSVKRADVRRANHWHTYDMLDVLLSLGIKYERFAVEDDGYDYGRDGIDQTQGRALAQICFIGRKVA